MKTDKLEWVNKSIEQIAHSSEIFTDSYSKWAMAIHSLSLSANKYNKENPDLIFTTKSLRVTNIDYIKKDIKISKAVILKSTPQEASKKQLASINYIVGFGIIDLYSKLETCIFDLYRINLLSNPEKFIKGKEANDFRRLYIKRKRNEISDEEWTSILNKRISDWQKGRIYKGGLSKIFESYLNYTKLHMPSKFGQFDSEIWAEQIKFYAYLRNQLIHGNNVISKELADLSLKCNFIPEKFVENSSLKLNFNHLMGFEFLLSQFCGAINAELENMLL